jgi:hypothetical protein
LFPEVVVLPEVVEVLVLVVIYRAVMFRLVLLIPLGLFPQIIVMMERFHQKKHEPREGWVM